MKLVRALLGFLASLQQLLTGVSCVSVHVVYDSAHSGGAKIEQNFGLVL